MLRFLLDLFWNRPWPASSIRLSRRLRRPNPRSREINPHAGSVQLQIARLCEAMIVARTMMMEGDLRAMDRLIESTGALDRYHGFGTPPVSLPAEGSPPRRLTGLRRELSARSEAETKIFMATKH
jgi:hypothetical protein